MSEHRIGERGSLMIVSDGMVEPRTEKSQAR